LGADLDFLAGFGGVFVRETALATTFFTPDFFATDLPDGFFLAGLLFLTGNAFLEDFAAFFAGILAADFFAFFLVAMCDFSLTIKAFRRIHRPNQLPALAAVFGTTPLFATRS
jgi:hypothetical protein